MEDAKGSRKNKGFSLVEIIIVIAIMSVLTGIVAPMYLKYVERAKIQKAVSNTKLIADAITVLVTDVTITGDGDSVYDSIITYANNTNPISLDDDTNPVAIAIRKETTETINGEIYFFEDSNDFISFSYTLEEGHFCVDYRRTDPNHDYVYTDGDYKVYKN